MLGNINMLESEMFMKRLLLCFLVCTFAGLFIFSMLQTVRKSQAVEPPPSLNDVTLEIVVPGPTPTPVVCTSLPQGMNLQVIALSSTEVLVQMSGLQKGELITLIYERDLQDWQRLKDRLEFSPSQPIGEDGYFEDKGTGLAPLPGVSPNRWQIQVVHSRGVACQTILLPEEGATNQ